MNKAQLEKIAKAMVAEGKGILAADESTGTIKKRFDSIKVESTEDNRRDYREMLFRSTQAMKYISGVILYDETIRQKAADKTPLVRLIKQAGAIPGIKVDMGAKDMATHTGEKLTEGLEGLGTRLTDYYKLGARFAKWRAVITIKGNTAPSDACLVGNTYALARYAALCQHHDIVPIVEPEVIMDGGHSIERCYEVTSNILQTLYGMMRANDVHLPGTILKPNMVVSGTTHKHQAGIDEVAAMTLACFKEHVPASVPGIVFLSGGQSDRDATAHLDAMNRIGQKTGGLPWKLSFSYGRALQAAPLKAWRGQPKNVKKAQAAFAHRAKMNGLAARGKWRKALET